MNIILL